MNRCLPLALLPLLALGCISSNPTPATSEDSGLPSGEDSGLPQTDATVPSDSGGDASVPEASTPEASATDSAIEDSGADAADAADAGPLPVTLTVTNDVGPEPGVTIVFQSETGAITGTTTTDLLGGASAILAPNSQITAFFNSGSSQALLTIQGVQPGDVLTAIDTVNVGYPTPGDPNVSIVSVPDASSPDASLAITQYSANAGSCSNQGTTPLEVTVGFPCEVAGKFPMLVRGLDGDGTEVAYTYQKGNTLPDAGTGDTTDLTLVGPWATDEMTQVLSATNVPNGQSWFNFTELAGNVGYPVTTYYGASSEDGGPLSGSSSFPFHVDYAEAVQEESVSVVYTDNFALYQTIAARIDVPDGSAAQFDMSQSLPAMTYANVDTDDAGTPSAPALTWASTASLATTDGLILVVQGNLVTDAGTNSVSWTIVAPPTAAIVTPPTLPASLGAWTAATDNFEPIDVIAVEASFLAGYAQFRTVAGALPTSSTILGDNQGQVSPPLPVEGTMRITALGQGD